MKKVVVTLDKVLEDRKMSAYRLAKETDISANSIGRIINRKTESIRFEIIEKICDVLDCNIEDILTLRETDL